MQIDIATRNNSASKRITGLSGMAWLMLLALLPAVAHGAGSTSVASGTGNAGGTNRQSGEAAGNRAGTCIAHICLETPITQKDLVAKYGPGRKHVSGGKEIETVTGAITTRNRTCTSS